MVLGGEGLLIGRDHAFDALVQVFERGPDLRPVGGARLLDRGGEEIDRIVPLRSGHRRRNLRDAVGLVVVLEEVLPLGQRPIFDECLWHHHAVAVRAGNIEEALHRRRPRRDHRHLPAELGHAIGDLSEFGADAVGEDDVGPGLLSLQQLGRHIDVLDVELLHHDRLHALGAEVLLDIFAAELAVIRRVGEDRDLLEALRNGLVDHHAGLKDVIGRIPEDVVGLVIGLFELVRDDRAGGDVVEHRNFGFLVEALRGQGHAGVDEADGGGDFFLVDEFLRDLGADLVLGLVVALDQEQLTPEHAAGFVDLGRREAGGIAHRHAHGG